MGTDEDDLDLDDAILSALDEQDEPSGGEPRQPAAKKDEPFPRSEDIPPTREYVREGRRFVAKETPPADGATSPVDAAAQKPPWAPLWLKPEHGVEWDKQPEAFRKAMEQREREFQQGIEKHATPARAWTEVEQRFAPYADQLKQAGSDARSEIHGLLSTYEALIAPDMNGRVSTLDQLCQTFTGRSLEQLAYDMQQAGYEPPAQPDPYVKQLEARLAKFEQRVGSFESTAKEQRDAETRAEIASFAKDKPHFDALKPTIANLMRGGQAATLADAYEQAQWLHPDIRKRVLDDQRKADVARARAGAQSPRGTPVAGGSSRTSPKLSLDEELEMQIDAALGGAV